MKLSEIKGDQALDTLAELIDPIQIILGDGTFQEKVKDKPKLEIVKILLKEYKKPIIEIMAILDGVPVDEYEINLLSLPKKLLEILNDEEVMSLFTSAEQTDKLDNFGSVSENIGA